MRLCTYEKSGKARVGVEVGSSGEVAMVAYDAMLDLISDGEAGLAKAREALASGKREKPDRLLAPVPRPGKIFGSGVNYRSHGDEEPGFEFQPEWRFFLKAPSSVVGPGEEIVLPPHDKIIAREDGFHVDYEVELGVVIGKTAKHIRRTDAMDYVFGYTMIDDVGSRSVQFRDHQEDLGKGFDTFCPMGPVIVTADEIPDYGEMHIRSIVNGEVRQDTMIKDQIFPIPHVIEWITSVMTMYPGDVISTGTPAGCGTFRKPPVWLEPGDVVTVTEDRIGDLTNAVVAGTYPW
jgi:2-keto-4-pentenoate hydratase/2-oxohepta-3-ene-1,7-dioic acid hydratase in catechol pathway